MVHTTSLNSSLLRQMRVCTNLGERGGYVSFGGGQTQSGGGETSWTKGVGECGTYWTDSSESSQQASTVARRWARVGSRIGAGSVVW
jgi:hypothetical protein